MRSGDELKKLIIDKAISDDRIRAVLLNGSRANSKILADKYQDFDIVYIVNNLTSFISDHSWTNIFGDRIILQRGRDGGISGRTFKQRLNFIGSNRGFHIPAIMSAKCQQVNKNSQNH